MFVDVPGARSWAPSDAGRHPEADRRLGEHARESGIVPTAVAACLPAQRPQASQPDVRREIERVNAENAAAFKRWDVAGIMALRAPEGSARRLWDSRQEPSSDIPCKRPTIDS